MPKNAEAADENAIQSRTSRGGCGAQKDDAIESKKRREHRRRGARIAGITTSAEAKHSVFKQLQKYTIEFLVGLAAKACMIFTAFPAEMRDNILACNIM